MVETSQVFVPFRSLGVVVNNVPFHLFSIKDINLIALPIGKTYQVLNCKNLRLTRIGPAHRLKLRALASYDRYMLSAHGSEIVMSTYSNVEKVFKGHTGQVNKLLVIGVFLVSIAENDSNCLIWDLKQKINIGKLEFPSDFHPTCIVHPDTYLNKVLVGSREGVMALYNLRSKKLVYEFPSFGSPITCFAQSPVIDVVAVGLADGRIIVHNLKLDKTIITFTQSEGAVTTLAFRSDKQPLLCSGAPNGQIILWDLGKRRLLNVFNAHTRGPIVHATFLFNEPVLVTAGSDNSVKMWVFDMGDQDTGRLLRSRVGHPVPPTVVRWLGTSTVIAASGDCIRSQKVMADGGTREFGVASQMKKLHVRAPKLPPITDMAINPIKQKDWDDVLTSHENSIHAHTWSTDRTSLGHHAFVPTERTPTPVKAVAISACGNFGYIGTASGWIDKYNMQSGIHRGASSLDDAHTAAVVGLCCDASNRYLLSASLDGYVKLWNSKMELEHIVELGCPINKIILSPHSQLLAIACDDLVIRLFDIDAKRTVRKFIGHSNLITDVAFSPDERWLVTSSTDGTVRVWDIPTGKMIDWFAPKKTVTSLSFSVAGDFLATTHINDLSVGIWSNKAYFSGLMLRAAPAIAPSMDLPTIQRTSRNTADEGDEGKIKEEEEANDAATRETDGKRKRGENSDDDDESSEDESSEEEEVKKDEDAEMTDTRTQDIIQLDQNLITLSKVPKAKWITLGDLDQIKERNKSTTKAFTTPDMPFFIPTVAALEPGFETETRPEVTVVPKSRIISLENDKPTTKWMQLVANKKYTEAIELLSGLSPSGVDFELHSVPVTPSCSYFILVLKFFRHELQTNYRFELVQAYMNRFLKIHSDVLMRAEVTGELSKLLHTHKASWQRMESIFHSNLCLVNYFSSLHV